ncbi:hypothetical protein CK203_080777 [Vitis vinifera]|uniref:Uncharacterized protein n=1 Tax=Vitis vinifera TaxID=29760 RepID=A0A438F817_VITVI|nr:hypothetical protein CK203_080777 [Vitis vinifera]
MHLARCGIVCKDKKYGSFGIRRLKVFNQALLSKWLSRFANEHDILWRKFIQAKYGEMDGGWSTLVRVQGVGMDNLHGKEDRKGKFSVKSYYISFSGGSQEMFLAKEIWRSLKNLSFCMGSSSKEDLNHRYPHEKRVDNGK